MSHDSTEPAGDSSMGSKPSQGIFIGGLALGLMIFIGLFTLFVLLSATFGS